ncbi:MAG: DUF4105 domain-containing protein [Bdellovibrionota bacterium]
MAFIFTLLFILTTGIARAAEPSAKIVKKTSDSIFYLLDGIPYSIRYLKKGQCNFTEREIRLIRETLQILPELYSKIKTNFHFEKKCDLDLKTDSLSEKNLSTSRVHLASSSSGKIAFSDRTFSYVSKGQAFQLNEEFSKRIITHELTHQLDRQFAYSKNDQFLQINSWQRSFGFMNSDKKTAEGFQREQGTDSPTEDLATQAEGFFFDPDYLCKHPQSYVWFYYWIGQPKVIASECPAEMNTPIDSAKVTAVGYMLISATSENAESNFGHSVIHFHMDPKNPFEDFVIQAAGNVSGMPVLTGFEKPEELLKKQLESEKLKVSRLEFLFQGASGQLDLKVQQMKYKLKWLEVVILEGRDISERILALTKLQTRVLVYMINKDLAASRDNYNVLTKNCSSYIARVINQAIGDDVASTNFFGVHSPTQS